MVFSIGNYIINKHYEELKDLSPIVRQTAIFKFTVAEMPMHIKDTDFIAGYYGFHDFTPELREKAMEFSKNPVLTEQEQNTHKMLWSLKVKPEYTPAHTCIDYGFVLNNGLEYYIEKVKRVLETNPENEMLRCMESSLNTACLFAERFCEIVLEKMQSTTDQNLLARLKNMHSALLRVPRKSARNFLEAVQCVWLMHALVPISEMSWASISLGRLDQYLYPF